MKIQQHTVKFPESNFVIDDWLWIDYHDRINVLVEAERATPPNQKEKSFLIFEQTKYALEGRTSKAIIGGIIEPGEEPEQAARREVEEEMGGLQCNNFYFLGRYRTDVNRGMGWLNSFLATDCSRNISNHKNENEKYKMSDQEEVGAPDQERQDLKTITLTQLREAARRGEFLEVQWSATVALALQHHELN
jgi:ADP-ribose pyrophosphatase YjhB (NUDIX family)